MTRQRNPSTRWLTKHWVRLVLLRCKTKPHCKPCSRRTKLKIKSLVSLVQETARSIIITKKMIMSKSSQEAISLQLVSPLSPKDLNMNWTGRTLAAYKWVKIHTGNTLSQCSKKFLTVLMEQEPTILVRGLLKRIVYRRSCQSWRLWYCQATEKMSKRF